MSFTIADTERRTRFTPVVSTTVFVSAFGAVFDLADIEVWHDGELVDDADYTVTGTLNSDGIYASVTVTFDTGVTGTVDIVGRRAPRRTSQFTEGAPVPASSFNLVDNQFVAMLREVYDRMGRGIFVAPGQTGPLLPAAEAGKRLAWDADGNLVNALTPDSAEEAVQEASDARDEAETAKAAAEAAAVETAADRVATEAAQAAAESAAQRSVGRDSRIINGNGRVNQRQASSCADDAYAWDRHYILTQTAAVAPSSLSDVADGLPAMMRLTQSQASAQRMGIAQIIEGRDCKDLRGIECTLGGWLRYSSAAALRFAILEWTGTEDAVTSDVVNDWTNGTFTAGNFFNSTTLTVRATGTITPSANTLTEWSVKATLGSSFNNLIVLIWTSGTAAQNVTLDLCWGFTRGDHTADPSLLTEIRPFASELARCERFYQKSYDAGSAPGAITANGSIGFRVTYALHQQRIFLLSRMRAAPSVTFYNPITGNSGSWRDASDSTNETVAAGSIGDTGFGVVMSAGTVDHAVYGHWVAEAEL